MSFEEEVADILNQAFRQFCEDPTIPYTNSDKSLFEAMQDLFSVRWPEIKLLDVYLSDDESDIIIEYDAGAGNVTN